MWRIIRKRSVGVMAIILGAGGALGARQEDPAGPSIASIVREMKLAQPMGWQKIPWINSLSAAREASKRTHRPVFLFSYEGNIQRGRC
jgi:hypothetical protein